MPKGRRFVTREQFAKTPTDAVMLRKVFDTSIEAGEAETRTLRFTISTSGVDRDNDVITASGWDLSNYLKSPVVLWAHQYDQLPVGKAKSVKVDGERLTADVEFVPGDVYPFAETVFRMLKGGFLGGTSVGFKPKDFTFNEKRQGFDFKRQELLEFSVVPIPANPDALMDARAAGVIDDGDVKLYTEWIEKGLAAIKSVWSTEFINNLPDSSFAYIEPGGKKDSDGKTEPRSLRHLPYKDADGKVDPAHCRNALSRLPQTQGIPDAKRAEIESKLRSAMASVDGGGGKQTQIKAASLTAMDRATKWTAPTLAAYTEKAWADLSSTERRSIAGHYAYADSMPPETFGALDFPHHNPETGEVVWDGLVAAMTSLLSGENDTIPEPQRKAVYDHLASHYAAFKETAPAFAKIEAKPVEEPAAKALPREPNCPRANACLVKPGAEDDPCPDDNCPVTGRGMPMTQERPKHYKGFSTYGFTAPAKGTTSPEHVHEYGLVLRGEDLAGGQAHGVADHSHRITAESLAKGETEPSDGHVHKLLSVVALGDLVMAHAAASGSVTKVGRVLAARNESRLRQAASLLTDVLSELDSASQAEPGKTVKTETGEEAVLVLDDEAEPPVVKDESEIEVEEISAESLQAMIQNATANAVARALKSATGELD